MMNQYKKAQSLQLSHPRLTNMHKMSVHILKISLVTCALTKVLTHRQAPSHRYLYVYCSKTAEAAANISEILRENLQWALHISVKNINILQGQHGGQTKLYRPHLSDGESNK